MQIFFSLLLTYAFAAPVPAPQPNVLTLKESLSKGLAFSVEVQKAESEKRTAEASYRSVEAYLFPTIDLKGQAGLQKQTAAYRSGFLGTTAGDVESYRAYLQLSQPIYQGGLIAAGVSAGRLKIEAAIQKAFDARQKYAFELIEVYLRAAQNQLLLELAKDNRTILKSYADVTARYASIGRSKNIDRLTSEASYNLAEAEVLNAESEAERSFQDLFRYTGLDTGTTIALEKEVPLQPVEAGTLDQLYQRAVENNPEIRSLELGVRQLKYENDVKMAEHMPKLTLDGTYGYDSPDRPNWFKGSSETYSVFLNLTIPLFSGFRSFAQRDLNREGSFQLERDLAKRKLELQQSLAKALATMNREFHRLKLTQISTTGARKAMEVALRDYRSGLLSSTDVLNIQRTRFDADKQFANAQFSYHQQVLSLRRDLGTDLEKTYATLK